MPLISSFPGPCQDSRGSLMAEAAPQEVLGATVSVKAGLLAATICYHLTAPVSPATPTEARRLRVQCEGRCLGRPR